MTHKAKPKKDEKIQQKIEAEVKELQKEAKKEVKEFKAEAKKEIKDLKSKNEELMDISIKAIEQNVEDKSKRDIGVIISIISLIFNVACWAFCFYLQLK